VFIFGNVVFAWCNQCQSCIANSTTIFEFVVANEAKIKFDYATYFPILALVNKNLP
jgi:hypothetical protein